MMRYLIIDAHCDTAGRFPEDEDVAYDFVRRNEVGHIVFPVLRKAGSSSFFCSVYRGSL